MKTFFSLRLKLTKKVTAFRCFQIAPPKKLFCAISPQTHYSDAGPASNYPTRPKPAQVSILVPNCVLAFF